MCRMGDHMKAVERKLRDLDRRRLGPVALPPARPNALAVPVRRAKGAQDWARRCERATGGFSRRAYHPFKLPPLPEPAVAEMTHGVPYQYRAAENRFAHLPPPEPLLYKAERRDGVRVESAVKGWWTHPDPP